MAHKGLGAGTGHGGGLPPGKPAMKVYPVEDPNARPQARILPAECLTTVLTWIGKAEFAGNDMIDAALNNRHALGVSGGHTPSNILWGGAPVITLNKVMMFLLYSW